MRLSRDADGGDAGDGDAVKNFNTRLVCYPIYLRAEAATFERSPVTRRTAVNRSYGHRLDLIRLNLTWKWRKGSRAIRPAIGASEIG